MADFEEQAKVTYEKYLDADYELLAIKLMAAHGVDRAQKELAERARAEALDRGAEIIRHRETNTDYA